ncbi:MAG TPA: hypothetical protein VN418_06070 [Gammaproteobacteria bacterium]|nr:hypothetical protein [Gammaproteobacteria bacterium]
MKKQLLAVATLALFSGYVFATEPTSTEVTKGASSAKTLSGHHGKMLKSAHSGRHHLKTSAKHSVKSS